MPSCEGYNWQWPLILIPCSPCGRFGQSGCSGEYLVLLVDGLYGRGALFLWLCSTRPGPIFGLEPMRKLRCSAMCETGRSIYYPQR
jgi:hypothetical protein